MDSTIMNFGDLLFAINCDPLKNEIRKIEMINKHIVQTKNGIYFNEICLKRDFTPYFLIYIYIRLKLPLRGLILPVRRPFGDTGLYVAHW